MTNENFELVICGDVRLEGEDLIVCDLVEAPAAPGRILICPWGEVSTKNGGFKVTDESAAAVEAAFRAHGVDLPIDYEHQSLGGNYAAPDGKAPAAGWIKSLEAAPGKGLYGEVTWTSQGARHVANREYRYLSPVVAVRKADSVVTALHSVALTNKPAIVGMRPIANKEAATNAAERTEKMDPKLLKMLGLAAEATEEQVQAKLAKLQANGEQLLALRESIGDFAKEVGDDVLQQAVAGDDVAAIANAIKVTPKLVKHAEDKNDSSELQAYKDRVSKLEARERDREWDTFLAANSDRITAAEAEDFKVLYQSGHADRVKKLVANKQPVATRGQGGEPIITVHGKDNDGSEWKACAEAAFKRSPQLRREFCDSEKEYLAFCKAHAQGLIGIFAPALQASDPYSPVVLVANALQTQYSLGSRAIIGMFYERLEGEFDSSWVSKVGMTVNSNQDSETYPWLGMVPQLREWIGGRDIKELTGNSITIVNKLFEATEKIGVDDLRRDKTGQIRVRMAELAKRASRHWEKLVSDLINAGAGSTLGLCYDGQYFYDTDHAEGSSGAQKNLLTSSEVPQLDVTVATAPTALEFAQALLGIIAYQFSYVDDQGEPINGDARSFLCMVAPSLAGPAMAAVTNAVVMGGSGSVDNPLRNSPFTVDIAVNPRLTSAGSLIYTFRTDGATKPFILQEEQGVKMDAVAEGSEEEFKNRRHLYGLTAIRNAGFGMWRHATKSTLV